MIFSTDGNLAVKLLNHLDTAARSQNGLTKIMTGCQGRWWASRSVLLLLPQRHATDWHLCISPTFYFIIIFIIILFAQTEQYKCRQW